MKRILISGAGIAGLTAAIRLAKAGMQPVIVEKAQGTRAGGYLVALSHQAYRYADEMGLVPDLRQYDLKIKSSTYHDKTGRCLLDLDYSKMMQGLDIVQLMRDDLAQVLYEHAQNVADIRFSTTITALNDTGKKVIATFSDGKEEEFDLIIGADGAHSGVRKLTFDSNEYTKHYLNLHCAAFRTPNVLNIHSRFSTHMERTRYMAVFNTLQDDVGAVFVWASKKRTLPALDQRRDYLIKSFDGSSEAIQKVLPYCPENEPFYMDVLSQVDMPTWHKGRIIVVGDGAHCLTLFSGRGAAAAFAGACRLCNAIEKHENPEEAFTAYEKEMRPVIDDIMPATRGAVKWYVPMDIKNHMIRNGLMRFVPNIIFRNYFKMKYSNV
jgi:2-polyprenyl-6-methoxyphenol hydroxylase-like FAD-dependent oxidoreductase